MNKLFLKINCFMLLIAVTGTLCACGKKANSSGGADPDKTNLYVYNYDGGIGTEWLKNAAARFEAKYADQSFESGKTGVKINITQSKNKIASLSSSAYNVFFEEGTTVIDYASQGLLLDISDMVTSTDNDDGKSLESKLTDNQKSAYTAINGKYYYLPHYETYPGICYDVKVFNDYKLFIKNGGGYTNSDSEKSVGPNGISGDYDDGLPSSYEEFFALMDRMVLLGVVPFIWSGQYPSYTNNLLVGAWAAYSGKDQLMLNVDFDSSASGSTVYSETVTNIGADGNISVRNDTVSLQNGYLAQWQSGKYYAYTLLEKIFSKSTYYSNKITSVLSHLDAQEEFINSDLENAPIAFLIEGSYWYNEAEDAFTRSVNTYQEKAEDRQFGWMPFPVAAKGQVKEGEGKKNTLVVNLSANCYINGNIKNDSVKSELAKKFVRFLYTDAELVEYTKDTGTKKGVQYKLEQKDIDSLNYFARNLYVLSDNSDVVYPVSDDPIYLAASTSLSFSGITNLWVINYNNTVYSNLAEALESGLSAKAAFMGGLTESAWQSSYLSLVK